MDDALIVCRLERVGDLTRDGERLLERQALRPGKPDDLVKRGTLYQFQHEGVRDHTVLETVDVTDVRMIERRQHLRLAPEPGEPVGVIREGVGKNFQRDVAIEPGVPRAENFAHPAFADGADDFVGTETSSSGERHGCRVGQSALYRERARFF